MRYSGEHLREISFPIGGIGTGCIGLAGNGRFVDFEIFNRPNKQSVAAYTFFAIRAEYPSGKVISKILQGDITKDLSGSHASGLHTGFGFGPLISTMCGFPHFKSIEFEGRYPMASIRFFDEDFPAEVILEAYNPFIPHDAKNTSIPCAIFNLKIKGKVDGVRYTVVFCTSNPFENSLNEDMSDGGVSAIRLSYAGLGRDEIGYGDVTISTDAASAFVAPYWYRGGWRDAPTTFWFELENDSFAVRDYESSGRFDPATLGVRASVGAMEEKSFNFVFSWNCPNCYNYWSPCKDSEGRDVIWKNYYATVFEDSLASARYVFENLGDLYDKTVRFTDTLHSSTLDSAVIDAVSSTLSVLRSPTVLRLENGAFYGWEGVAPREGSCEGTCTHVWSYAYALCFLFPELERSIRDTEFREDVAPDGRMSFRTQLPLGRGVGGFRACLDGQMATVIKTYREWKISGDGEWLASHWETVKSVLEYAWSYENYDAWDKDKDGILEGRQHHTLDMELFGPSAWLEGMYLAALRAGAEMAEHFGELDRAEEYMRLFKNGYAYTKEKLFNGRYFIQNIDLSSRAPIDRFNCENYWNAEQNELKYQIGEGCEIDQLLGQWHASLCGLGDVFDKEQRRVALRNMYKEIYKPTLREYPNAWRVFALGDEGGAIMCAYPEGAYRPVIPIPYVDECMTGFEYAFAGMLISEGFIEEGLSVVRSIRDRYDGKKRNPYNEIECGSNYARPMASFALLPIFSGFEYDMTRGYIGFSPIVDGDFKCLWSVGNAWGSYERVGGDISIKVEGGSLHLRAVKLGASEIVSAQADGKNIDTVKNGEETELGEISVSDNLFFRVK
ncbi:MAG: hypothetical protein E7611_09535 [Ruminococcaceae bacterium]|nr:hypothetical protein [Oscillospiraceae bacterium]